MFYPDNPLMSFTSRYWDKSDHEPGGCLFEDES
jgi:hypothetical protein